MRFQDCDFGAVQAGILILLGEILENAAPKGLALPRQT
jgi:hypothetical protein